MNNRFYCVDVKDAHPGLLLAKDVYSESGVLIAAKNFELTDIIISRFHAHEIENIIVYTQNAEENLGIEVMFFAGDFIPIEKREENIRNFLESSQQLQKTEYKQFKKNYIEKIHQLEVGFHRIAAGQKIEPKRIYQTSNDILHSLHREQDVFQYLLSLQHSDDITYSHCLNVSLICNVFGQWLGLKNTELEMLTTAGLLHDIGKTQIPKDILFKNSKLTSDEYEIMKTHVVKGYRILERQNVHKSIQLGILMHHEKLDGTGYPTGSKGNQIPLFPRIIAIADIYDALTQNRPYREGICVFDALDYMQFNMFGKLDPSLIDTLCSYVARSYQGLRVRLSNEEEGEIVYINKTKLSKPMIRSHNDVIDLESEKKLLIKEFI